MSDAPPSSPPPAFQQTSIPVYSGPSLDGVRTLVASEFHVQDAFLDPNGLPTIIVSVEPPKQKFERLLDQLAEQGLIAALRSAPSSLIIKVFQKPKLRPSRRKLNLVMLLTTVLTVSLAGYILWTGAFVGDPVLASQFDNILAPGASPLLEAAAFAVGLLAIIGLHEFGHKATANLHKMDSTLPYFIPGPPPIGTFGALISLRSPPRNRDHLFDLGLSGPVVGFIVTIAVMALSIAWGVSLSQPRLDEINTLIANCGAPCAATPWPYTPLILTLVCEASSNCISPNFFVNQQLFSAAQIGALLTFLNIVPAWQLDGGHISRAVYGPTGHRVSSYIGLGLLLVAGYWPFAFLIFIMTGVSGRGLAGVEPLDDVSPLSKSRRVAYLLGIAMLVMTFAYSPVRFWQ